MNPTEEQMKQVCEKVFDEVQRELGFAENVGTFHKTLEGTQDYYKLITKAAITEWEKIRNKK